MHPEVTWELNIAITEEELLMGMRKTTRYLIRQALKNPDIEIVKSRNAQDLKLFWPVYRETAKRHHFVVFTEKYLQSEFDIFSGDNEVLIFLGKYKGQVVSAAIFVFWQDACFYHHSGSRAKFNKIPVSYLLQWEAIKEARSRGCRSYNFWGIAPEVETETDASKSRHPWAGLSLFKMGFGGHRKTYVETQDFVLSSKYWFNFIIEKIRKHRRNL
jgi:lipid II:glycine glycyltransferase (peptidoglycan interpeptide bridge formation enzyme)